MKLADRRALVTGASSGIGRAIAVRLAQDGCAVAVTGRRAENLEATAAAAREAGGQAVAIVADHRREADNERAVAETVEALGGIDILVNAAGIIGNDRIRDADPKMWRSIMDINVEAVYDLTRRAVEHLVVGRSPSVLNVSSVCSHRPFAGILAYCVSKAAIDMFTKVLALELAPDKVRVNAVNPGVVVTELHSAAGSVADYEDFLERSKLTHPIGRVGTSEEIAELAAFLVSDQAGWITGAIHSIDGGRGLTSMR